MPFTKVIVTGFGKFADVLINPTTQIVDALRDEHWQPRPNIHVDYSIVEVSTLAADAYLSNLPKTEQELRIHLGVDSRGSTFKLESSCYNNMTFRVPDENGFMPSGECISGESTFDEVACSSLPLRIVCESLNSSGFNVVESIDPGRFLCNYIYYKSLQDTCQCPGSTALFIHVPPIDVFPLETQIQFVKSAIECILTH